MSEPSLEYNLGKIGYSDIVQLSIVAYKDGSTYLALIFSSPSNKRLKPALLILTDFGFSELYRLLMEAEVQINKLLTSNRISSVSLPQTENVSFRSNLGSVAYTTVNLTVTVVVMAEGNAFLQLYAHDSKSRSSGFLVMFDDNEFTKLKTIFRDNFNTIIKPKSNPPEEKIFAEVRNQNFVTISEDGILSDLDVRNASEAHIALKEIGSLRKELNLQKNDIEEKIKQSRADYKTKVQQQNAETQNTKGGWFNILFSKEHPVRKKANTRIEDTYKMTADIASLEKRKNRIESQLSTLSRYVSEIEKIL